MSQQGARRVVGGDVPWLWQGLRYPRITQGPSVGELEPKLHSLGVSGWFDNVAKLA